MGIGIAARNRVRALPGGSMPEPLQIRRFEIQQAYK